MRLPNWTWINRPEYKTTNPSPNKQGNSTQQGSQNKREQYKMRLL